MSIDLSPSKDYGGILDNINLIHPKTLSRQEDFWRTH